MKDTIEQIKESDADVVIMCDVAYGDSYDELIKMSQFIKETNKSGKSVIVIPFNKKENV